MKPIESVGIGLLYYNKGLQQFERSPYMTRWTRSRLRGWSKHGVNHQRTVRQWTTHGSILPQRQ